jgi:outer membrane protein assembly factor BamB
MKIPRFPLLIAVFLLGSLLLSGCGGTLINSWPGVSTNQNTVYLAFQGQIYAVNADNGALNWRFPEQADPAKPFYAAPAVSERLIVAGNYGHVLYGINPTNGAQLWAFDTETGNFAGTPLIVGDTILAPSSNNYLYAVNTNGELLWRFRTGNSLWTTPSSDGERAYVAALDHHLYALNLSDGSLIWKTDMGSALASAPVLAEDGTLYVSNLEGEVGSVNAADGKIAWKTSTGGRVWSTPVLHEDVLYVGNAANKVSAISAQDGSLLWQKDAGSPILGGGAVLNGSVAFPTEGGSLIAWSLDGESLLWNQPIGGKLYTAPVIAGEKAVVALMEGDKILQALDLNGQLAWTFSLPK